MAWPKGKPRTGYVKKDGTAHAKRGALLSAPRKPQDIEVKPKGLGPRLSTKTALSIVSAAPQGMPRIHGESTRPIVEPCPNCGYAYADGGACPECPWVRYDRHCPHCRKAA